MKPREGAAPRKRVRRLGLDRDAMTADGQNSSRGRPLRLGLVGPHHGFGLRYQNLEIARQLTVERWLSPRSGPPPERWLGCFDAVPGDLSQEQLRHWLDGLDAVLFVEAPWYAGLTRAARSLGIPTVFVANWEWVRPELAWLAEVDLVVCPTRFTFRWMTSLRDRMGFGWQLAQIPWPIDPDAFTFRRRHRCRRFVYVHGGGGTDTRSVDGQPRCLGRKGVDVILEAAGRCPDIPWIIYANWPPSIHVPENVDVRPLLEDRALLYNDGEVCVQPSRWEGLGLPLLECQAAGMPLITTDAPPMNEHHPLAVIPVPRLRRAAFANQEQGRIPELDPDELLRVVRQVHGRVLTFASGRARRFVLRHQSWARRRHEILDAIERSLADRRDGAPVAPPPRSHTAVPVRQ